MEPRTKIVATLGPATSSAARIRECLLAGVDVFRINLSHGERDEHARWIATIREVGQAVDRFPAILVDLQGPRVRLGKLEGGTVHVKRGDRVDLVREGSPSRRGAGPAARRGGAHADGFVMSSGRTSRSNCSPVSAPSSTAASRSVLPSRCAFFAIVAAVS